MDTALQSMMSMAGQAPVKAPQPTGSAAAAIKAAKEYEGVFVSQFLGSMFSGIPTDGEFGGGQGEEMFRSLMVDQYGKDMEKRGGFGLAAAMQRQLLKNQEVADPQSGAPATSSALSSAAQSAAVSAPNKVNQ
jgi:flagellar protein FlgJ